VNTGAEAEDDKLDEDGVGMAALEWKQWGANTASAWRQLPVAFTVVSGGHRSSEQNEPSKQGDVSRVHAAAPTFLCCPCTVVRIPLRALTHAVLCCLL
jgi:hypothetical protein